jgi:hypothetical protein
LIGGKMEIAIIASLFAKGYVNIEATHQLHKDINDNACILPFQLLF